MNYATIKYCDIANGTGVRTSLFVSGCTHHCKGCFNQEAWDFNYGTEYTDKTENEIIQSLKPSYVKGLSLLGGEPFEPQNQPTLACLVKKVKLEYTNKDIWCYTGYTFEQIISGRLCDPIITKQLLTNIDVLVDGEFIQSLKDISLEFRGSSNQRIIKVKDSIESGEIKLYDIYQNI